MNLFRPSREEYDSIEKLGNPGWNWDSLLQYIKKVCKTCFRYCHLLNLLQSENTNFSSFWIEDTRDYAAKLDESLHGSYGTYYS